jgi:hypothetical protein
MSERQNFGSKQHKIYYTTWITNVLWEYNYLILKRFLGKKFGP